MLTVVMLGAEPKTIAVIVLKTSGTLYVTRDVQPANALLPIV